MLDFLGSVWTAKAQLGEDCTLQQNKIKVGSASVAEAA
jgi:hypothetical protein